jgi:O-antigen/teichoic acid export membrane protein
VLTGIYCFTGPFLHLAHPGRIALLTAMAVAFQAFCNLSAAALRGLGEMRYSSLLGGQGGVVGPLANTLFLVAIAGLAAIWQLSLSGTLAAYVCCFGAVMAMGGVWLVRTASAVLGTRASNRQALSAPPLRATTLLVTCCPMLLVQVLAVIAKQGGLWVAGGSCPADELALYAGANRAIQLVSIPLSLVNLSVMAFIPQLRTEGRLPELQQILRISAGWAAIPSFLALLAFVIAPAPILEVFLGPFYRQAAVLLSILSLGQFILVWVGSSELTLVLSGHARTAAVVNATTACTLVIGGPLVARQFGVVGLAVLAALVIGSQSLAQWLLARRLVGVWTHATLCPWRKMNSIR